MDIRNKRFVETVYKIEGEETNRIFIYEIDSNPVNMTHLSFTQLVENFDRLEGTDYAENIKIIREEIIESKFVDDPKVTRSFEVEVPIKGYYTQTVEVEMSKYTPDHYQFGEVEKYAFDCTFNDAETDRIKTDVIWNVKVDYDRKIEISAEVTQTDETVAEDEQ